MFTELRTAKAATRIAQHQKKNFKKCAVKLLPLYRVDVHIHTQGLSQQIFTAEL